MPSVLFICTGNMFRSPIAEAAFRQLLIEDGRSGWTVSSAGTWATPGQPPPPATLELARLLGLDLSGHRTRLVDEAMLEAADVVLVMESGHKEAIEVEFPAARQKVHLLMQVLTGRRHDIPDPITAMEDAEPILRSLVDLIRSEAGKIIRLVES
ncbi:MAG: Protein-arginine-phosphatase [Anaerolineales bacterium]|nr:Protein-arginine-phosphatase [Anaerolineales bacterium]